MNKDALREYLNTRRLGWAYEDTYLVEHMSGHRFVARIGDELAGLSYAEVNADHTEAVILMDSIYMYDPDGNLVEIAAYRDATQTFRPHHHKKHD